MNRLALALLASLSTAPMAGAAPCDPLRPLPPGFTETILHEFDTPVTLVLPLPDGRAVVGLGNGKAHVMAANGTLGAAFVDYMVVPWTQPSGNVIIVESEGGVIGGAVSPTFDEDGYFYLSHTTLVTSPTGRDMRITRFTIDPGSIPRGRSVAL